MRCIGWLASVDRSSYHWQAAAELYVSHLDLPIMAFPESLKLDVKHKAAFRCCRCQAIGVEIHHVVPKAEGGADTNENAAPLCAKCHSDFGDNPLKRKEIREMRDWWYQRVSTQASLTDPHFGVLEEKLDALLVKQAQSSSELDEIKKVLLSYASVLIDKIDITNVRAVVSSMVNIEKPPLIAGSPCQMSGQHCPVCADGIMDVTHGESGVECNKCGIFIPVIPPQ